MKSLVSRPREGRAPQGIRLCLQCFISLWELNTQVLIIFFSVSSCVSERFLVLKMIQENKSSQQVNRPTQIDQNHHLLPVDTSPGKVPQGLISGHQVTHSAPEMLGNQTCIVCIQDPRTQLTLQCRSSGLSRRGPFVFGSRSHQPQGDQCAIHVPIQDIKNYGAKCKVVSQIGSWNRKRTFVENLVKPK